MKTVVLLLTLGCAFAQAQNADSPFQIWVKGMLPAPTDPAKAAKVLAAADAGADSAGASGPTLDASTSAIVDRSDPGKFFGAAFYLASNNGRASATAPTGSVTVTLYSIAAAISRQSLVDPKLYEDARYARRLSFSVGSTASDPTKDGTDTAGALYGLRWRIIQGRDLFTKDKSGVTLKQKLQNQLNTNNSFSELGVFMNQLAVKQGRAAGLTSPTVELYQQLYDGATATERAQIDRLLKSYANEDLTLTKLVEDFRDQQKRPKQLTVAYFTNQRSNGGADDHRLELIYDHGINKQVDWTLNGGFEYRNVMNIGGDRKGGRLATEAKIRLFQVSDDGDTAERWVSLDMGGEWKASTNTKPYLKGQIRLSIPLTGGVSLPVAWSYESRPQLTPTTQLNDSYKRFRFGIEFDPAKISNLVK